LCVRVWQRRGLDWVLAAVTVNWCMYGRNSHEARGFIARIVRYKYENSIPTLSLGMASSSRQSSPIGRDVCTCFYRFLLIKGTSTVAQVLICTNIVSSNRSCWCHIFTACCTRYNVRGPTSYHKYLTHPLLKPKPLIPRFLQSRHSNLITTTHSATRPTNCIFYKNAVLQEARIRPSRRRCGDVSCLLYRQHSHKGMGVSYSLVVIKF
jgi:hypothetical protein